MGYGGTISDRYNGGEERLSPQNPWKRKRPTRLIVGPLLGTGERTTDSGKGRKIYEQSSGTVHH